MTSVQLSPNYKLVHKGKSRLVVEHGNQEYQLDDLQTMVAVFRDRVFGWFLDPAKKLIDQGHASLAVHIVTPYIEALDYYKYKKGSKTGDVSRFKRQATSIFTDCHLDDKVFSILYHCVRCGFAHYGFLSYRTKEGKDLSKDKGGILISPDFSSKAISWNEDTKTMTIYARTYVENIGNSYDSYCEKLKQEGEDSDDAKNFRDTWQDVQWNDKKSHFTKLLGQAPSELM